MPRFSKLLVHVIHILVNVLTLIKTSILNGIAVLVRTGTALVLNKVLAVYVGPTGFALIGQLQSMVALLMGIASGAIGIGVTKYTAEYEGKPELQMTVWGTAVAMGLLGATLSAALLIVARESLAIWLLKDVGYSSVFLWLALSLVLMIANGLLLAIMNGMKAITPFVLSNISGSLVGAAVSLALVFTQGLYGALIALGLGQAVACVLTGYVFRKTLAIRWRSLWGCFDTAVARRLTLFGLMAVISSIATSVSQIVIRDQLGVMLGQDTAGLWQAIWRISDMHLMLITSTLTVYFLPRLSALPVGPLLRLEVLRVYRFVIPLVLISSAILYVFREVIIKYALTDDFFPIVDVFGWQLLGDAIKICSWVAGITLISHARISIVIFTDVIFSCLLAALSILGAYHVGLQGTAIGYMATYLFHLVVMLTFLQKMFSSNRTQG